MVSNNWKENPNGESYTQGLSASGHPIYQRGWTLYMGPQPKKPAETPSGETPPKNSENTMPAEAEKTEE